MGVLHWDQQTIEVKLLAAQVLPNPNAFLYDTAVVSHDLATRAHIQECSVGQFVALVPSVLSVENE